jgi:hypothetical protein
MVELKSRVESGKDSFNDLQRYNKTFSPKARAPFKTQSHQVIPVAVFRDINNPLMAKAQENKINIE